MKEKIKNFLLKIKKFFTEKHTFSSIELIIICVVINFLTLFLSYAEIMATDSCFNETHIEQVENVETERYIIDRDIKGANPTQSDYVNVDNNYRYIYLNTYYFNSREYTYELITLLTPYFIQISSTEFIYPVYAVDTGSYYSTFVVWLELFNGQIYYNNEIVFLNYDGLTYNRVFSLTDLNFHETQEFFYNESNIPYWFLDYLGVSQDSVPFMGQSLPIGFANQYLYNYFSSVPFENNSTPTLENAPSSLVNNIPQNALTSTPSNLGVLVYDSGSNFVNLPTGHNANTFGVQIYYKSSWHESYHDRTFTYNDYIYHYRDPLPYYSLSEVNLLIYTLWDDIPIYYNLGNVLDIPMDNYPITTFDAFKFFNMLYTKVNVINEYADFWHLDIDIDYEVEYQNTITAEYGNTISYIDYGFEMLIPHDVSLADIGYKGFSMEKFVEFDSNYKSALYWMSSATADSFIDTAIPRVFEDGYNEGDSDGFQRGFELNGDSYLNATNPVLNFINKGAKIVSDVLDVQVLPNITFGTIMLFPLVIALIWFIIKLFMGG